MSLGPSPGKALDTPRLPLGIGPLATLNWKGKGEDLEETCYSPSDTRAHTHAYTYRHARTHTCTRGRRSTGRPREDAADRGVLGWRGYIYPSASLPHPSPAPPEVQLQSQLQSQLGTGPSSSPGVAVKIVKAKHRHQPPDRRLTSVRVRSCDPGWTTGRFGKGLDMLEALGQQLVTSCVFRILTGRAVLAQPWK